MTQAVLDAWRVNSALNDGFTDNHWAALGRQGTPLPIDPWTDRATSPSMGEKKQTVRSLSRAASKSRSNSQ
jgi:hypothetical protein